MESTYTVDHEFGAIHEEGVVRSLGLDNADVGHPLHRLVNFFSDHVDSSAADLGAFAEGLDDEHFEPLSLEDCAFDEVLFNLSQVEVHREDQLLLFHHHLVPLVE